MGDELPPWLDSEFLETVLKEGDESRQVEVVSFTAKLALPPGDNYTSHIFRVKVEYKLNKGTVEVVSLMVKAPITKGVIGEMQSVVDLFAAEPQIYQELLPKLKKKIGFEFGPKSYPCPIKGPMILQDLKEDGFILKDRLQQLDFAHCKIALTKLAQYHAASVAVYHDDPGFIRDVGQERMYRGSTGLLESWEVWFPQALTAVGTMIKGYEGCERVGSYVLERASTVLSSMVDLCKPREGHFNVMNHGDFWMSNMLFKHDDNGKVVDVKFLDFQVPRYNSPALDILYFIFSSASEEARIRLKDLLDGYLQTLNNTLESVGCEERLSSEEFNDEMKRCVNWGVVTMCNLLPMILCDPTNVLNMEEFSEEDFKSAASFDKFTIIYKGKRLQEELPKVAKLLQTEFL